MKSLFCKLKWILFPGNHNLNYFPYNDPVVLWFMAEVEPWSGSPAGQEKKKSKENSQICPFATFFFIFKYYLIPEMDLKYLCFVIFLLLYYIIFNAWNKSKLNQIWQDKWEYKKWYITKTLMTTKKNNSRNNRYILRQGEVIT